MMPGTFVVALAFAAAAMAQTTPPDQTPQQQQAAAARKEENREAMLRARDLIREMGLQKGMTVADVNVGLGFMLPFLSRNVGPEGRVIAEDSSPDLLAGARQLAENQKLENIEFVKGTDDDPNLPEGKVDVALAMNVYHRLAMPQKLLAAIYKALKPQGRLVLVEHYQQDGSSAGSNAPASVRFDMPELIREMEANHFHVVAEKEREKNVEYILVLEKKS